jgi:hypothetical protein
MIRLKIIANRIRASASGYDRFGAISPPIGTTLTQMQSASAPGAIVYSDSATAYVPEFQKYISEIAAIGAAAGGTGFTDTGLVQAHGDIALLSIMSILGPGENPGQSLKDTGYLPVDTYLDVGTTLSNWGLDEYEAARAAGVCAPYNEETEGLQFMSGIATDALSLIALTTYDGFIGDSANDINAPKVKKLQTTQLIDEVLLDLQTFLSSEQSQGRALGYVLKQGVGPGSNVLWVENGVQKTPTADNIVVKLTVTESPVSAA